MHKNFYEQVDLTNYKSILALNGDLPEKSFFAVGLPVIAADGAANKLHQIGIKPQTIIGDLDTVNPELLKQTKFIHLLDQNSCDFDKALEYAKQFNLLPTIIVGVNGGYIDHILNNIGTIIRLGGTFYDPPILGQILNINSNTNFSLPINTKLSLIGTPKATVSTSGLKWELKRKKLFFAGNNSCFNRTVANVVIIKVHSGNCLVMSYLEKIQDAGSSLI